MTKLYIKFKDFFDDTKYFFRRLKAFFKNLWYYKSILWHDRDFDHSYFLELMKAKLKKMERHFDSDKCYSANGPKDAAKMRVCIALIDRLLKDEYADFYYQNMPEDVMITPDIPNESGLYPVTFKDFDKVTYFGKTTDEFVWKRGKEMRKQDYEYLFKLFTKHLETWWD